jgi:type I restriction enzyme S subunit
MSESLADWLPPLPISWKLQPFFSCFEERRVPNLGLQESRVLSLSYGRIVKRDVESNFGLLPASFEGYNIVEPEDIVMRLTDLQNDQRSLRTGQVTMRGVITSAYVTVIPSKQLFARFAHYLLHGYDLAKLFYRMGGGLRQSMKFGDLKRVPVVIPPVEVQKRIANFLDEQTARIDALIAEKELLMQRLVAYQYSYASKVMTQGLNNNAPLVETSFPEIGAIPAHWTVKRLKFLGDVRSGVAKGKDNGDKHTVSLPYLRVANVQDGYVDLSEVLEIEVSQDEAVRYLLKKGDVLMNEGGDNDKLGRGTVWEGQIHPCIHQNHVFAVRLDDLSLAEWLARFTSTDAARTYFFLRSKQSTNLASINQSNVRELPIPMPPDDEREAILVEIRRASNATTELLNHTKAHITRLREYRSSLISAAVTGQLDVGAFKEAA